MASNASSSSPHDSGDRPSPSATILLPFRVGNIRATGDDGVVRMKRDEYDDLLIRQPNAALSYIDEDDGEVVLVGSSLELDHRLQEPTAEAPVLPIGTSLDLSGIGKRQMHRFEVEQESAVVETWRQLDQRTTVEGRKAKELFFGRNTAALDKGKQKAEVRFGQVSPPRGSLKASSSSPSENHHASRWASYSNLPGSFNHEPVHVATEEKGEQSTGASSSKQTDPFQDNETISSNEPDSSKPRSAFDVMADATSAPVRSSTLQVPTTQKQSNEYQPLIDMFLTEQKISDQNRSKEAPREQGKQWQPLLDLFEGQLAELTGPSSSAVIDSSAEGDAGTTPTPKGPFAQKSSELLTQSIQSLLNGVGLLAATFRKTNSELQQQIALAQQDFPNNIEKALKASVAAIESLKSMIPAANIDDSVPDTSSTQGDHPAAVKSAAEIAKAKETKDKILLYRYKLQKHLLKADVSPTQDEILMLNGVITELELSWKNLEAEMLVETKIHKVMKAIGRMSFVPGDNEYAIKERCAALLSDWMKTLEAYRRTKRNTANAKPSDGDCQPGAATETTLASASEPTIVSAELPRNNTSSVATHKEMDENVNLLTNSSISFEDDQVERVERATETMRRQLLDLGLLPPAEQPLGGVYTRADVLEAYIKKFNELKSDQSTPSSVPAVAADHMDAPRSSGLYSFEVLKPEKASHSALDRPEPKSLNSLKTFLAAPRKAVSFDHLVTDIDLDVLRRPTEASAGAREPLSNLRPPPLPQKPRNEHKIARLQASLSSAQERINNWPQAQGHSQPTSEQRQVRHRQSWHPTSTLPPTTHDESYPFSFSPNDVMARYPPMSQIYRDSQIPQYHPPPRPSTPATHKATSNSLLVDDKITSDHPTLWRSSTFSAPSGASKSDANTEPIFRSLKMQDSSAHDNTQAQGQPEELGFGQQATQRSLSTRVTRAEQEKPHGGRQQRKVDRVAERRRRRFEGEEPKRVGESLASGEQAGKKVKQCIKQLTGMGFARSRANTVAFAVEGNLEMALDVLNEDSAAWAEKAKRDEQRAPTREREDVPGSWGSWDEELYG